MTKKVNRKSFAQETASAYFAQYINDDGVMNEPQIYYSPNDNEFGWCSTLTPLSGDEIQIMVLEHGCFGDDVGTEQELAGWLESFDELANIVSAAMAEDEDEIDFWVKTGYKE